MYDHFLLNYSRFSLVQFDMSSLTLCYVPYRLFIFVSVLLLLLVLYMFCDLFSFLYFNLFEFILVCLLSYDGAPSLFMCAVSVCFIVVSFIVWYVTSMFLFFLYSNSIYVVLNAFHLFPFMFSMRRSTLLILLVFCFLNVFHL